MFCITVSIITRFERVVVTNLKSLYLKKLYKYRNSSNNSLNVKLSIWYKANYVHSVNNSFCNKNDTENHQYMHSMQDNWTNNQLESVVLCIFLYRPSKNFGKINILLS